MSNSCSGSLVKISSLKIKKKCEQSLKNIKVLKAELIQSLIRIKRRELEDERLKKAKTLWSRVFGYNPGPFPTDEEIQDSLSETYWVDMRYSSNEDVAWRLFHAAEFADEIFVSTEDLERLL